MKHLKTALFVLICLSIGIALGLGVGKAIRHYRNPAPDNSPHAGNGDAPPLRGFYYSNANPPIYDNLPPLHATAIALEYTPDPSSLAANVQHAHSLGLKVILLPSPTPTETNPYPQPLPTIAAAAQTAKVDVLCISWLNADPDPAYWQPQIAGIRKTFAGQLILAATPDTLPGIEFLDQVDLLGAIGPFDLPLPKKPHIPDMHAFRTAWACYLDSFESIANRYGKKIVLLDVAPSESQPAATDSLRDEAVVTETKGRAAVDGLFLPSSSTSDPKLLERITALWLPTALTAKPTEPLATDTEPDTDQ